MKLMMISDLLSLKRSSLSTILIALFVGVICAWTGNSPGVAAAVFCVFVPTMCLFSVQSFDEQGSWNVYRLSLPISRSQIVIGRYGLLALITVASCLVSIFLACLLSFLGIGETSSGLASGLGLADDLIAMVASALLASSFVLFMLSVTLPLLMVFGFTKAIRLIPLVLCIGFLVLCACAKSGDLLWIGSLFSIASDNLAITCVILTVIFIGIYALSCLVAAKLYSRREL